MYLIHGTLIAALLLCNSGVKCEKKGIYTIEPGKSAAEQSQFVYREEFTPNPFGPTRPGQGGKGGQGGKEENATPKVPVIGAAAGKGKGAAGPPSMANLKFSLLLNTTERVLTRTTFELVSQKSNCDYVAYYCLKDYRTGKLCARTLYYKYQSFQNYCLLDYVNCKEGYDIWQVVHMGECFKLDKITLYQHYPYDDDSVFDQIHVYNDW